LNANKAKEWIVRRYKSHHSQIKMLDIETLSLLLAHSMARRWEIAIRLSLDYNAQSGLWLT
jgi:hypothetical protein